jgi:hypothetical protein
VLSDLQDGLQGYLGDRYRIERELGRGGMAIVYLAEDLRHRRKVALKVLKPELSQAIGPRRFLHEIEIAARLNHPHILPLHDSGEAGALWLRFPERVAAPHEELHGAIAPVRRPCGVDFRAAHRPARASLE